MKKQNCFSSQFCWLNRQEVHNYSIHFQFQKKADDHRILQQIRSKERPTLVLADIVFRFWREVGFSSLFFDIYNTVYLTSLRFAGGKGIRKTFFKCFHSYIWIMEGYVRPCTETRSGNSKTSQNTSGNPFVSLLQFRTELHCTFFFFVCAKPIPQIDKIELPCSSFLQKSQGLKNAYLFLLDKAAFIGSNTTKFLILILQF